MMLKEYLQLRKTLLPLFAVALYALGIVVPATAAEAPKQLWQRCQPGEAAGQCAIPRGLAANSNDPATDPNSGHVYVADQLNARIDVFDAWGRFVKAWGWGVVDGSPELQTCTTGCRAGLSGPGSGQLASAQGLALDVEGNVYVVDKNNHRVQKFDPGVPGGPASFVLMFGGEVNKTAVEAGRAGEEDICPAPGHPADVCQAGTTGSAAGQFSSSWPVSSYIGISQDTVYVGDSERIQEFGLDGTHKKDLSVPGETVFALAVDSGGDSYVSYSTGAGLFPEVKEGITKLGLEGEPLCSATAKEPYALAVDPSGDLYAVDGEEGNFKDIVIRKFGSNCAEEQSFVVEGLQDFDLSTGIATGSGCGIDGNAIYFADSDFNNGFVRAYYPHPDAAVCPPPSVAPTIEGQHAYSVGSSSAVVGANINPHFWPDTTYYLQYGTEDCSARPDACQQTELYPGLGLEAEDDEGVRTPGVPLANLRPDTTYYYRFIAKSSGGGPSVGVEAGEEAGSFRTYPSVLPPQTACPNQGYRTGLASGLPDCRAYEMVSPVNKEGGDIIALFNAEGERASLNQGAASGNRFTFSSYRAFGDPPGARYTSQYLASRTSGGWASEAISPRQEGPPLIGLYLESDYKAFDEELCNSWLIHPTEPPLAAGAVSGYANLYRRSNCGGGGTAYDALTTVEPQGVEAEKYTPTVQGFSVDGSRSFIQAPGDLQRNGVTPSTGQLYEQHQGTLRLVCVLPGGNPSTEGCSAGNSYSASTERSGNRVGSVYHAVSDDGTRVFWTEAEGGPGKLYVRINGSETVRISNVTTTRFWTAAANGSRVIFGVESGKEQEDLYEYDVASQAKQLIADEVMGVMGASADAGRVYFASKEDLGGTNSQGQSPKPGEPNLYLHDAAGDSTVFIATLVEADSHRAVTLSPISLEPFYRTSRVSPNGLHAVFTSAASLTGADNTDAVTGEATSEAFLYDASSRTLRCVSCSPSGTQPRGAQFIVHQNPSQPLGGWIPGWTTQFHPSRALSSDGGRVVFNSVEQLTLGDTNESMDVYEWEEGSDAAQCRALGAEMFLRKEGGCLSLISSGSGSGDSQFLDASTTGRDVFFTTGSSLVTQDPGLIDVYDAREGGGFAAPVAKVPCEGQACQGSTSPPAEATPASSTFTGPGNLRPAKRVRQCPKGKRKVRRAGKNHRAGRPRCVRKRHKKRQARHKARRGDGRHHGRGRR